MLSPMELRAYVAINGDHSEGVLDCKICNDSGTIEISSWAGTFIYPATCAHYNVEEVCGDG